MASSMDQNAKSPNPARTWSYHEAVKAVPYLQSVVGSLREEWLRLRQAQRAMQLIEGRGMSARQRLSSQQDAERETGLAESRFAEALAELAALNVDCLDAAQGLA